jgi:hypothetical protein
MIQLRVTSPRGTVKSINDEIVDMVDNFTSVLQSTLKQETPKKTGRASRGWTKQNYDTVQNTVPYINRLEDGYSKQKPRGFVKQSVRKAIRKTSRSIR